MTMTFLSTKTYGAETGLSCCYRQWRADSHCNLLHGYALSVRFVWSGQLDHRNWVVDFGGLKDLKHWLKEQFDHTTLIASDDPYLSHFEDLAINNLIDLRIVDGVGTELFAKMIANWTIEWMESTGANNRVKLEEVEVREHGANSAIFRP